MAPAARDTCSKNMYSDEQSWRWEKAALCNLAARLGEKRKLLSVSNSTSGITYTGHRTLQKHACLRWQPGHKRESSREDRWKKKWAETIKNEQVSTRRELTESKFDLSRSTTLLADTTAASRLMATLKWSFISPRWHARPTRWRDKKQCQKNQRFTLVFVWICTCRVRESTTPVFTALCTCVLTWLIDIAPAPLCCAKKKKKNLEIIFFFFLDANFGLSIPCIPVAFVCWQQAKQTFLGPLLLFQPQL